MKRSIFLLTGTALMLFGACQENSVMFEYDSQSESSATIDFSNYVGGMTRASKSTGASFVAGDEMGVFGFQTLDGFSAMLFNNQLVRNVSTGLEPNTWTYEPKKYWDQASLYDFYAIYPYGDNYAFDNDARLFTVNDFTVADTAANQIDLMIAQRILAARPFNKVNFVFSHILSNVNFYLKTSPDFNVPGISSITVLKFDVTGLDSKGSFAQDDWSSNVFTGQWTADTASVYDLPEVSGVNYAVGQSKASVLAEDLLLLPQTISDDAELVVTYKLNYDNGDESVFRRTVKLNSIMGVKHSSGAPAQAIASWLPNYRYNYTISVDPSVNSAGGHHMPIINPDHDAPDYDENPEGFKPTSDLLPIDNDEDGIPDEWWVDEDMDDIPDYPVVWEDIDGDGKEEGLPDRDGDGIPDDTDGDGNPDVIMIDTDGDGIVDTELERDPQPEGPDIPALPATTPYADFNGGEDEYMNAGAYLMKDADGEYWIDEDGDGDGDVHILWKDIDGDGMLEGIADKDGNGILTPADSYDNDGKDYLGKDNDYDVIIYLEEDETTGEMGWKELEREPYADPDGGYPDVPESDVPNTDYDGNVDGYQNPTANVMKDADNEYWIDLDADGEGDIHIVWKDIDNDGKLEGIADQVQDGLATEADNYDNDGKDYLGNNNDYDVVLYQEDENGVLVWKELERDALPAGPELPDVEPRNADYDGATDGYTTATANLTKDADGEYWIDINGDDKPDYHILWMNIDDDMNLEGIVDKNKDGKLTAEDAFDTDGKNYKGETSVLDAVLYLMENETTGELEWVELEKGVSQPEVPVAELTIEFSAEVTDWVDYYEAERLVATDFE